MYACGRASSFAAWRFCTMWLKSNPAVFLCLDSFLCCSNGMCSRVFSQLRTQKFLLALHERAELCALSSYLGFDLCGSRAVWPIYIDLHWWAQPKHLVLLLLDASIPIGAVLGSAYRVDVCPVILQRRDSIGLDLKDNHVLLCSGATNLTVSGRGLLAHGLVWPWGWQARCNLLHGLQSWHQWLAFVYQFHDQPNALLMLQWRMGYSCWHFVPWFLLDAVPVSLGFFRTLRGLRGPAGLSHLWAVRLAQTTKNCTVCPHCCSDWICCDLAVQWPGCSPKLLHLGSDGFWWGCGAPKGGYGRHP